MENTTSKLIQCPSWCVTEHNELEPANSGNCDGERLSLDNIWNRSIGNGEASGDISRITEDGVERFYLGLHVEDGLLPNELELAAKQFDQLAAILRELAQKTGVQNG